VKEEEFHEPDMLNNYFKNKSTDGTKRKRGRPPKASNNLLTTLLTMICMFTLAESQRILNLDRYYYCEKPVNIWEQPLIDINHLCHRPKTEKKLVTLLPPNNYTGYLWMRQPHSVEGTGVQCTKYETTIWTYKNFWGTETSESGIVYETLTRVECDLMRQTKKCNGKEMTCEDGICKYDGTPNKEYKWMSSHKDTGTSCILTNRTILAYKNESYMFGRNCKPSNLECKLSDSIVIWDENIIQKCELRLILAEIKLTNVGNDVFEFSDVKGRGLVQIKNKVLMPECGAMDFYATSEGVLLSVELKNKDGQPITNYQKGKGTTESEINTRFLEQLMEDDDVKYRTKLELDEINKRECENLISTLKSFRHHDESYITLPLRTENEEHAVFYIWKGQVVMPKCIKLGYIEIDLYPNTCHEHLKVDFKLIIKPDEYRNMTGFLYNDNIIVQNSQVVDCKKRELYHFLKSNQSILVIRNGKAEIHHIGYIKNLNYFRNDYKFLNFVHLKEMTKEIDIAMAIQNQLDHKVGMIVHQETTKKDEEEVPILTKILTWAVNTENQITIYWKYIKIILYLIIAIVVIIVILRILSLLSKLVSGSRVKQQNTQNYFNNKTFMNKITSRFNSKNNKNNIKYSKANDEVEIERFHTGKPTFIPGLGFREVTYVDEKEN